MLKIACMVWLKFIRMICYTQMFYKHRKNFIIQKSGFVYETPDMKLRQPGATTPEEDEPQKGMK